VKNSRPVFSTESGRAGDIAGRPAGPSAKAAASAPVDGIVRIFRERAGRNGKVVTVIRGLPERGAALEARAAELRRLCGAGGTVKNGAVEIQGDHRERVAERLGGLGYRAKLAGG